MPKWSAPRLGDPQHLRSRLQSHGVVSDSAFDFVSRMLNMDPRRRPTANELLHHPFIVGSPIVPLPTPAEARSRDDGWSVMLAPLSRTDGTFAPSASGAVPVLHTSSRNAHPSCDPFSTKPFDVPILPRPADTVIVPAAVDLDDTSSEDAQVGHTNIDMVMRTPLKEREVSRTSTVSRHRRLRV